MRTTFTLLRLTAPVCDACGKNQILTSEIASGGQKAFAKRNEFCRRLAMADRRTLQTVRASHPAGGDAHPPPRHAAPRAAARAAARRGLLPADAWTDGAISEASTTNQLLHHASCGGCECRR